MKNQYSNFNYEHAFLVPSGTWLIDQIIFFSTDFVPSKIVICGCPYFEFIFKKERKNSFNCRSFQFKISTDQF